MKLTILMALAIFLSFPIGGCAVFAEVEKAPYQVIEKSEADKIELRNYDQMILVSTSMAGEDRNGAFRRLFAYISGANTMNGTSKEVPMTAPVFMDDKTKPDDVQKGKEIPMTAPVFMDAKNETASKEIPMTAPVFMDKGDKPMMSFVMPADYTLETTPEPTNPDVVVEEVKDYTVAAIIFSGTLSDSNIAKHKAILEQWIKDNNYTVTGAYKTAGYNAPFTLPMLRRNEVIIPVKKP